MPTYQYRCTQCGHQLEIVQKFSDPALTVCEECQGALRKVYNAVGVVFKGSGFYRTDSRAADGKGKGKETSDTPSEKVEKSTVGASSSNGSTSGGSGSGSGSSGSDGSSRRAGSTKTPAASSTAA